MKTVELKVTRIGNSRGVRLPATTLERYLIVECSFAKARCGGTREIQERLANEASLAEMKGYEIRWAALDPVTGAEMAKTRAVFRPSPTWDDVLRHTTPLDFAGVHRA